jgi:hypothetical protein
MENSLGKNNISGMLKASLPLLNDPEEDHLPASLPFTVDAHVHLFPDHLFAAVWQWFDQLNYFPKLAEMRTDRIMFGTDFPNLPYAWDREIRRLIGLKLSDDTLERILGKNALEFYQINNNVLENE